VQRDLSSQTWSQILQVAVHRCTPAPQLSYQHALSCNNNNNTLFQDEPPSRAETWNFSAASLLLCFLVNPLRWQRTWRSTEPWKVDLLHTTRPGLQCSFSVCGRKFYFGTTCIMFCFAKFSVKPEIVVPVLRLDVWMFWIDGTPHCLIGTCSFVAKQQYAWLHSNVSWSHGSGEISRYFGHVYVLQCHSGWQVRHLCSFLLCSHRDF
jgi:hypothetical protein